MLRLCFISARATLSSSHPVSYYYISHPGSRYKSSSTIGKGMSLTLPQLKMTNMYDLINAVLTEIASSVALLPRAPAPLGLLPRG
ncbi:hypothetical protein BDV32DRAFT_122408, partial [Aspergillus pseudonomiae]